MYPCKESNNHNLLFYILVAACAFALFLPLDGFRAEATLLFFAFFLPVVLFKKAKIGCEGKAIVWLSSIFIAVVFLYSLLGISSAPMGYTFRYFGWFVFLIVGVYLFTIFNSKQRKKLFYIIYVISIVSFLFIPLSSLLGLDCSPNAYYSSMIMVFSGIMLIWALHSRKNSSDLILSLFGFAVSVVVNFFYMERLIAILLSFVMYFLILVTHVKKRGWRVSLYLISILIVFVLSRQSIYEPLLTFISDNLGSERLSIRIEWLLIALKQKDASTLAGSLTGRFKLVTLSVETWTKNPITILFGVGDHRDDMLIGNHSDLIDTFARFGLFIGVSVLILYLLFIKKIVRTLKASSTRRQCIIVTIMIVLRSIVGQTFHPCIALQAFVFLLLVSERSGAVLKERI